MIKGFNKHSKMICYFLAFIIPVIYMLIISAALNFSPFGNRSPLVADVGVQFEVYYSYLKSVFFGNNDMFYTLSKTLGGDMAGFSFYYLGNPFIYLLVFLPNEWMPAGVLFIIILLMALSSLNFNIMANNIFGFRWSSLLFSISYAFMGYFMAYYNFIIYFNNIMILPIIILGLYEITIKDKISYKYIIFLSASIITNYYIGYMTCIFCGFMFIFFTVYRTKKIENIKRHVIRVVNFIWESLLAVMISAVALLTVVNSLMSGQKIDEGFGLKIARGTNFRLTDVFSGFYSISFNGNISDGLPIIYCSTLAVIFMLLYFMNKEIKIKEKIASAVMILIFVVSFYVKFVNRIWHGMAETVGFPYRYSFFLSFFILLIAYRAFINLKQGTRKFHVLIIFAVFVIYSLYMIITDNPYVGTYQIILTGAFLCMILAGIYAICYKREYMYPITLGFFVILSFDILLNGHYSIGKYYVDAAEGTDTVESYDYDYNKLKELYDYTVMDNGNTDDIYRFDKLFRRHHNEAMLLGYSGLSHFSSTEDIDVIEFMKKMGFCGTDMWAFYGEEGSTAFADSFLGLKYMASQYNETGKPYEQIYVTDTKDYYYFLYKNPYALPIAFMTKDQFADLDTERFNHFSLQNEIAKGITGKTYGIYRPVEVVDVKLENVEKYEKTYTVIDSSKEAYIEYEIKITSPDFIYMYFDAPAKQKAKIQVNGMGESDYFSTYGWSIRCAGYFEENTVVPVRVILNQEEIEIDGYEFYYENKGELERWYEDTAASNIEVKKISSSHLLINTDVTEDRNRMVLSIPYDKGWHVYVDGEEIESEPAMSILESFILEKGRHVIEMRYIPQGFILGSVISIIGITILLSIYIIERKKIRKLLKGE